MAAALGIKDSFMRMGSLDGLGDYRTLSGAGRLANAGLSPYTSGVMLGRLNSPANISHLRNLTPPSLIQPNHTQNLKMHPVLSPAGQNPSLFQGIQSSLELEDLGPAIGSSSNLLNGIPSNPLMGGGGGFGNQSSHNMAASFNTEPQNANVIGSSNSLLFTEPFHGNNCSNGPYIQNNSIEFSSSANVALGPLEDSNAHSMNMNQTNNQRWGENRQNFVHGSNNNFGSLNSHIPANDILSPLNRSLDQNGGIFNNQKMDMFVNGRSGGGASTLLQQNGNEKLGTEPRTRSNENFMLEQPKLQGGFVPQSYDSLDDLVSAMIKREQDVATPNCDFGFDDYSFGQGV
ncbi:hypothetical protein RD792_012839 [Penstemon davidsonii]|uniref:Uncharacterized protein n=1 Tax=Penstemon davidsonii TaxID=160366 RepID=A0ABR0CZF7_9LAMI|nr:hypothetical protein RD792_012839 [Penstemon davidsonii]